MTSLGGAPSARSAARRTRRRAEAPRDADALVTFALQHALITSFRGSFRHTESDDFVLHERTIPDYNLIYVWRGAAVWTIAGVDHRLSEGSLLVVPPGVLHAGRSDARVMTLGSIHVVAELPGGQDLFALLAVPRLRRIAPGCHLDRIFRLGMEEYRREFAVASTMIPYWSALAVKELLRLDAAAGRLSARGSDAVVAEILRFLERTLAARHSLSELARRAGYTPQHLNRRFLRALGMTPLACLAGMRMVRAAALLREGRLSVQSVSEAVGHRDAGYFSRLFRARFGSSPSDFRYSPGSIPPGR